MKRKNKKVLTAFLAGITLLAMPFSTQAVQPSGVEYSCVLNSAVDTFVGNETPIDAKDGEEMYLVYTVKSVDAKNTTSKQHGVLASDDGTQAYPYEKGGVLNFNMKSCLLDEGYTYFYKFAVKNGVMSCEAVKAKGNERAVITFSEEYGDATDDFKYFGIWFGSGTVTAKLTHVMCYTADGKDLGVRGAVDNEVMSYDTKLQHAYSISSEKVNNLALSNAKKTDADVIYMEYTVDKAVSNLYQTGVISTSAPQDAYPFEKGVLLYDTFQQKPGNGYLLEEGASYIVRFERKADSFDAKVQKAKNGTFEKYTFQLSYGDYNPNGDYVSLWFGEGGDYHATFELSNLKCYDAQGNHLGIQSNQETVKITHYGELEDYAGCESVYYCEKSGDTIALYENQQAKVTRDGTSVEATYRIQDDMLYLSYAEGKESYEYFYQKFQNENESFRRLGTYYATFVTGTEDAPKKQKVDIETGYTVLKPDAPKRNDAEFECWVTADGTEYNFDNLVTESITLYAKWSDGIAYTNSETSGSMNDLSLYLAIGLNVLLIAGGVTACIWIRRKSKR